MVSVLVFITNGKLKGFRKSGDCSVGGERGDVEGSQRVHGVKQFGEFYIRFLIV